jgi:hypothetical protein
MSQFKVWGKKYPNEPWYLFSDGITREMGLNKVITMPDGGRVLAEVQPLRVDPLASNMIDFGTIECHSVEDVALAMADIPEPDPERVKVLDELTAQAQELGMGY